LRCVLDASAALSLVLEDEFTPEAQAILDYVSEHGAVVPPLWFAEVANGLLTAWRRGRLDDSGLMHATVGLERLHIREHDERPGLLNLVKLASQAALTAYDATYLWLADRQGAPLATRDERLADAAIRAGITLLTDSP
jgi:predicted nucleic acid-binding protein